MRRRALLGAGAALPAAPARAQAPDARWVPAQPIRMVVPHPPGGTTDVLGRTVAEGLGERLGRQVVVDNGSGASGIIGTEYVKAAAPDGTTLVFVSSGHGVLKEFHPTLPFDPDDDGTPIARIAAATNAVLGSATARARMDGPGARVMGGMPEELDALIRTERARWGKVIREAGIRPR